MEGSILALSTFQKIIYRLKVFVVHCFALLLLNIKRYYFLTKYYIYYVKMTHLLYVKVNSFILYS
jgi:hypothetical protein